MLNPGQSCPVSGKTAVRNTDFSGVAPGLGPVRPLTGAGDLTSNTQQSGWLAIKSLWFSDPTYQGPFLVRIRRLDGSGPAGLLENPLVTSFFVPAGPTPIGTGGFREVTGATWVKTPGCVAWQVDGLTFSNVIVTRLLCRPPYCTLLEPPLASQTTGTARASESDTSVTSGQPWQPDRRPPGSWSSCRGTSSACRPRCPSSRR